MILVSLYLEYTYFIYYNVIHYKFYIKYVFRCKGNIKSINSQTKITIITVLHSKKIHFTQNQRINAIFQDSNSRKRQQISARNTIVAASSMPFNLIAIAM